MNKFLTTICLLSGLTIGAQTRQFEIDLTMDQNLAGASWVNSMTVDFSPYGSNFNDTLDQSGSIANAALSYPFTVNSSYTALRLVDARPTLRHARSIAFGAWNGSSGEMHVQGHWSDPADAALYDVVIRQNSTGFTYDMYSENTFNISEDTNNTARFTIFFMPKISCTAFDATCYTANDGSVYAKSPSMNWSMNVYHDSVLMNSFNVAGIDTLLTGLGQGTYDIEYLVDGVAYDTASVIISSYAPVISSATLSDSTPTVGQTVTFTNTSTGAATYFWDFGDGFNSTATSPGYSYSSQATYTVTLTATSAQGCTATSTYVVTVGAFTLVGPPANNMNRDEDPVAMARTSSQVQSENNQAAVTVRGDATLSQFSVYSMNGQLLFAGTAADNTFSYGTPGIYLIHILYSDGTSEAKQWYLN